LDYRLDTRPRRLLAKMLGQP